MTADAERRGGDVVQSGSDGRAFQEAGQARCIGGNSSNDLVRARGWRQSIGKRLQTEEAQGVIAIVLRPDIGE